MSELEHLRSPDDLRALSPRRLRALADEVREFLVDSVARTGGHLGPNLGVVELTLAIHRVFSSPRDSIVFDTGHQAYVHKLLTGRQDFAHLRQRGGLSGYPSRTESDHDVVENSHASTALSWADGISRARLLAGDTDRYVVAVIGDGALTGGMAWEALNNLADSPDQRLVIVVNDNGWSYSPTVGGLARYLDAVRTDRNYERMLGWGKRTLHRAGPPGRFTYDALHGMKKGLKDVLRPQHGLFEELGLKSIGPVDGHDLDALDAALRNARRYAGPVIVHAITEKGRGYVPAESDLVDRFHTVGKIHPETGLPVVPSRFGWTSVFSDEILKIARTRSDVVGITAAMPEPVGLAPMARELPGRVIDVGIAEEHALTSAAGMAFAGMHPVVSLYATFVNRAFDQLLMDVALHRAGVTITLDRAGITGDDGASHNGMWDLALLRIVPGLQLAAPRDEATLRSALREAVAVSDAPTVVRYPKGALPEPLPAQSRMSGMDVLAREAGDGEARVLVVGIGPFAATAVQVVSRLKDQGIGATALDPRWVIPVPAALVDAATDVDLVVTIEDGLVTSGFGAAVREAMADRGVAVPVQAHGIPHRFLDHASRAQLEEEFGLRPQDIAREVSAAIARGQQHSDAVAARHASGPG
ncbi:1-deoxy-D-xylulose-5-phosphate synthase [Ruania halotolerans]|uniref:1-deoxy-D-xylulose-5-phosphate synthase n=1 Tax=Ruania halotolerans TaxID=2897773 RepID=UPI001E2F4FDE|nr:1-deoxy-D-xylulose-5-phosphate synthase [Ruania halotolerans]UFU04793.1 1-deoxy-D-xylulose-5-phosphate synthase [Ruania halotolerans]